MGMSKEQIIAEVSSLANSQGFYCRILERLRDKNDTLLDYIYKQNYTDVVDMVMGLEG